MENSSGLLKNIKTFNKSVSRYFSEGKKEIALENLATLRLASLVGLFVSFFLFAVTPKIIPSWSVTNEYFFILPILAGSFLFSYFYLKKEEKVNSLVVQIACILFYALMLADFIALSVFPYPNAPQIFITICYMFMPALLTQRPRTTFGIMLCSEVVFVILIYRYKPPQCVEQDLFNSMAAGIFSMIESLITTRLRVRNYEARAKLRMLSMTDSLTGILNKTAFEENCAMLMNDIEGLPNCALIVMDLDNFKDINDKYGHQTGDETLAAVGTMLKKNFRYTDLVGRIGGDEFCILMRDVYRCELARMKLERIMSSLENLKLPQEDIKLTGSFGCAVNLNGRVTYLRLFKMADEALYSSKAAGKMQYTLVEINSEEEKPCEA